MESEQTINKTGDEMRNFTTTILTEDTKNAVKMFDNAICFANEEEIVYQKAMTNSVHDSERYIALKNAFNDNVKQFARNYGNINGGC
tara:strand:+ start:328 stop:588 length:261 start_codon:yes stop_codon:yes gene_type:complete